MGSDKAPPFNWQVSEDSLRYGYGFYCTQDDGTEISVRVPRHVNMADLFQAMRSFTLACGFTESTVAEYFGEAA